MVKALRRGRGWCHNGVNSWRVKRPRQWHTCLLLNVVQGSETVAGSGGGVVVPQEDKAPWALWTPSDGSLLGFRNLGDEPRAFLASNDEKGKTETPKKGEQSLSAETSVHTPSYSFRLSRVLTLRTLEETPCSSLNLTTASTRHEYKGPPIHHPPNAPRNHRLEAGKSRSEGSVSDLTGGTIKAMVKGSDCGGRVREFANLQMHGSRNGLESEWSPDRGYLEWRGARNSVHQMYPDESSRCVRWRRKDCTVRVKYFDSSRLARQEYLQISLLANRGRLEGGLWCLCRLVDNAPDTQGTGLPSRGMHALRKNACRFTEL